MSKRRLTPEEVRLWRNQLKDVKPLSKIKEFPEEDTKEIPMPLPQPPQVSPLKKVKSTDVLHPFQRREVRQVQIEAQLDLHGLSLERAYDVLEQFLRRAQEKHFKIVLVITGKGSLSEEHTLRHLLPRWLEETPLKNIVSSYHNPARLHHGGAGAYYVRLRKKSNL
ncbi:MAG: Smr/MutS family protein [Alphaproteobacteria bacterium]|nr:Smr/MutS family protein [Alphaproteobacteria bacterium]